MLAEREHAELTLLNNHKHVHPRFGLGALPCALPVLLPAQHPLLRPRRPKECELFVRDTNIGRRRSVAAETMLVVFSLLTDDRVRKIGREAERRGQERHSRTVHALVHLRSVMPHGVRR